MLSHTHPLIVAPTFQAHPFNAPPSVFATYCKATACLGTRVHRRNASIRNAEVGCGEDAARHGQSVAFLRLWRTVSPAAYHPLPFLSFATWRGRPGSWCFVVLSISDLAVVEFLIRSTLLLHTDATKGKSSTTVDE